MLGGLMRRADVHRHVQPEAPRRFRDFLAVFQVRFGTHQDHDQALCHT